jgi:hypothetical protein
MPAVRPPAEKHVIGMTDDRLKKRSRTVRQLLSAKQRTQILKMGVTNYYTCNYFNFKKILED